MPEEKDKKNKSIIPSGQQGITKYSSDLIRRGLDSIAKIEQKDRGIIPYRRKITPENARQVRQIGQLDVGYRVHDIKFSPDGKLLAVSSESRVYLYNANKLNMVYIFEDDDYGDNFYRAIAFSPDGTILASTGIDTICLWRISDGSFLRKIDIENGFLTLDCFENNIAFSPDGTVLASSVFTVNDDADYSCPFEIHFYRVSDGLRILDRVTDNIRTKCVKNFPGFEKSTSCAERIAFSPDGAILAFSPTFDPISFLSQTRPDRGVVWLWSFPDGCYLRELKGHSRDNEIEYVTFSPDGTILAGVQFATDLDYHHVFSVHRIYLWRVSDGFLLHDINPAEELPVDYPNIPISDFYIRGISINSDGTLLASCGEKYIGTKRISGKNIHLWNISNGFLLCMLGENSSYAITFNPDGTFLASVDTDNVVRFWGLTI